MTPDRPTDDETRAELLNATVDGVATHAQRAALAELLERDPSAREELEALRALADLLGRTPAPGVPESLVDDVMTAARRSQVAAEDSWVARLKKTLAAAGWSWGPLREESTNLSSSREYVPAGVGAPKRSREDVMARQQNMFDRRMILAGAGVLAVAGLVVYFGGFYPPANEEAYGTIGAADRYRSTQITAADVKLDSPEVQAFLQSETFDRIVRDPAARQALSNADLQAAILNDKFADAMALSVRLSNDASKLQAGAASLNRDALDLQMKIKTADAATLDRSAADLALKAIDFQRQIKVADAARLDQSAAQLAQKAMEFQKQIKVADAATLDRSAAELAQRAIEFQKQIRLSDAARLDSSAADLAQKAAALRTQVSDANRLDASAAQLAQKAAALRANVADAFALNQSALDLTAKAIEFQKIRVSDANRLDASAAALAQKAMEFQKIQVADANRLDASAAQLAQKAIEFQKIKVSDAARLDQAAAELTAKALEFQKIRVSDANRLDASAAQLAQKAIEFQKIPVSDAAALDRSAADLASKAAAFSKQMDLVSYAGKLNAMGLDARGLSAISQLSRSGALHQAVNQHAAAALGRQQ